MKIPHASAVVALAIGSIASCSANEAASTSDLAETAPVSESSQQGGSLRSVSAPATKPQIASAASDSGSGLKCEEDKILFGCKTTNNKQVLLCDQGQTLGYSFGKMNDSPELALSVPREQATTFQWHGIGRYMTYSVTVPNGNTTYTVFTSLDRISDEHEFEAGVIVSIDDEQVANIPCMEPIKVRLEGVDLRQAE